MFLEFNVDWSNLLQGGLFIAIIILGSIICLLAIVGAVMSIVLCVKYWKFNHKHVQSGAKGHEVARQLLDENDLQKIKVRKGGLGTALTFGNSYSHFFKKIRLRGFIYKKDTITSVAMASEKVGLAVLDKENDPDMRRRIRLWPIVNFGPWVFILFFIVGLFIDLLLNLGGIVAIIGTVIGLAFYIWSFLLAMTTLKTEQKAQKWAIEQIQGRYMNDEEIAEAQELFKLYNINYVIDMVMALLEAILQILKLIYTLTSKSSSSSSSSK